MQATLSGFPFNHIAWWFRDKTHVVVKLPWWILEGGKSCQVYVSFIAAALREYILIMGKNT